MSTAFFWIFIALLALGAPVVFALLIGPGLSLLLDDQSKFFATLLSRFYNGVDSYPLLAVPFFILAGELMNAGGISRRIIDMAQAWVGHIRGGLGFVAIGAAVLMASMSGSALADTAALATILLPMMRDRGYPLGMAVRELCGTAVKQEKAA